MQAGTWLAVSTPVDDPDAIIVLASHEWERLPAAAELARRYPRALVVLPEPGTVNDTTCFRCAERPWTLASLGVGAERIRTMPMRSGNTYEEALAAFDYCQATDVRSIVVVTSPYHARRALATFTHVFGSAANIGLSPAVAQSGAVPDAWWTRPYDRRYVVYEIAASIAYWFRYRITVVTPSPNLKPAERAA